MEPVGWLRRTATGCTRKTAILGGRLGFFVGVVFFGASPLREAKPASRGNMARGDVRIAVTLACENCKRRNYQTNKSKRNTPDRLTVRKYCPWCKDHQEHRETR